MKRAFWGKREKSKSPWGKGRWPALVVWILAALVGVGCSGSSDQDGETVVLARVADEPITDEDFVAELRRRAGRMRVDFDEPSVRESILAELVDQKAQLARARALGLERDPIVRREIESLLLRHLRARELDESIEGLSPSEEDVADYYAEHGDEFARPARVRAAIVKLELPDPASEDFWEKRRAQAEALLDEAAGLSNGFHGFGPIAARVSDHRASRYKGGDIGWLVRGEHRYPFAPSVLDAIFALESPGELGPIVEGSDGFYLVRMLEVEPRSIPPLAQIGPQIRQRVLEEARRRVLDDWLAELRIRADVEIEASHLGEIVLPPELAAAPEKGRPRPPKLPGG